MLRIISKNRKDVCEKIPDDFIVGLGVVEAHMLATSSSFRII